jgi:sulfhydrogenase subunit beta (sulfur reductase)
VNGAARRLGQPRPAVRPAWLAKADLPQLVLALQASYEVVAPTYADGAIVLARIGSAGDVAVGYRDQQRPGHYRIEKSDDGRYFGYNNGADSPKKLLHPARLELFSGELHADGGFTLAEEPGPPRRLAFFGIRPCDAFAVLVLDKTFLESPNADQPYRRRRAGSLLAVINCTTPGATCFCASMGTGPRAVGGYDLALTELGGGFLVEAGSSEGAAILGQVPARPARRPEVAEAEHLLAEAIPRMGRTLNTHNLPRILRGALEHPQWDVMKNWCIGCTNCTIVCPTCFCNDTHDIVDLNLRHVARERVWDSCFTWQFAELHGGNARPDLRSRYRHWLTHKLGYWVEQYGVFGCVGCGRCLTWCPVGIDITEVATAIRGEQP